MQAGAQTLSLTGSLSADGTTMTGTYSSIDAPDCGTAQSGLQWRAVSVPPLSGMAQGNLHSLKKNDFAKPNFPANQDFPFTGTLTQSPNIGASNATITGTLSFPSGYPCVGKVASVNGQISGSSVLLQVIAGNGSNVGQIGAAIINAQSLDAIPAPAAFQSSQGGWVLTGFRAYGISSKQCPGANTPGDYGNICLALGNSTACTQPVLLSPAALTFPPQVLGSPAISQTITLSNHDPSGASLSGLTLAFNPQSGLPMQNQFQGQSDFSGAPNFQERDNCAPSLGEPFTLASGQSCNITITYSPQESCPWIPFVGSGDPPASPTGALLSSCPYAFPATVTVNSPRSADGTTTGPSSFTVPINGTGLSAIAPYNPFDLLNPTFAPGTFELDFGAEAVSEVSAPQTVTFTNQSSTPVEILPQLSTPCQVGPKSTLPFILPRPSVAGSVAGLQVVANGNGGLSITPAPTGTSSYNTLQYACDSDPISKKPNFPISADSCSGTTLLPRHSCSVGVSFAPQPGTPLNTGLDYFLQLNTLQCTTPSSTDCEIDSGRFAVELKANIASPLRMTPAAGLYFPTQTVGETSAPLTVTLFNDPNDPSAGTVNLNGNITKGTFVESDDCSGSLAPGSKCTLSIIFAPQSTGLSQGSVTIGYSVGSSFGQTQTIYLRGMGQ
ncbi:MAG TPA: choice-of-anchor D domain-containing protein [Terriglobales bacterium]|nr:choice-of-anchor D domain-containing protein [Terriglobales bacterium]